MVGYVQIPITLIRFCLIFLHCMHQTSHINACLSIMVGYVQIHHSVLLHEFIRIWKDMSIRPVSMKFHYSFMHIKYVDVVLY